MSMQIALSGLNAVSDQLGTISNNIANAGTTGFKSSRTNFGSVYSETQALGVEVLGKTQSISQSGSVVATGRTLDLAISGGGFFVTRNEGSGQTSYTRAGIFNTDTANYVVSASGQRLQGYQASAEGVLQTGNIGDLQLSAANLPARATDSLSFQANLDADAPVVTTAFDPAQIDSYTSSYTTKAYDSLGREHAVTQYFIKTAENSWDVRYFVNGAEATDAHAVITFNTAGDYADLQAPAGVTGTTPGVVEFTPAGANPVSIATDYEGSTQFGSDFIVNKNLTTGYSAGERTGLAVERDGRIYATYSNGQRMLQGQLVMANFVNDQGLANQSGTQWVETIESGAPLLGVPGVGQNGAISSGALENSNVDISEQLVGLMEAQRNYQANTKVLSTDKELNQVLFNAI